MATDRSLGRLGYVTGQNTGYFSQLNIGPIAQTSLGSSPSGTDTRTTNIRMSDWAIFEVPDTTSTPPVTNAVSNTVGILYQNETKQVIIKFKRADGLSYTNPPIGFATTQGIDGSKFDRGETSNPQTNAHVTSLAHATDKWITTIVNATYTSATLQYFGNWIRYDGDVYNLNAPGTGVNYVTSGANKRYAYYNLKGGSRPGGGPGA